MSMVWVPNTNDAKLIDMEEEVMQIRLRYCDRSSADARIPKVVRI